VLEDLLAGQNGREFLQGVVPPGRLACGQGYVERLPRRAGQPEPHEFGIHGELRGKDRVERNGSGFSDAANQAVKLFRRRDEADLDACPAVADVQALDERGELQLLEQGLQGLPVGSRVVRALQGQIDGGVGLHRGQLPGEPCLVRVFGEGLADPLVADLRRVAQHPLDGAVVLDQLQRRLRAHAGHAGDVVGGIPHESQHLGHPVGADAEAFFDACRVVGLVLHRIDHDDPAGDELHEVLVARDDDDLHPFALELPGQGSDHVVGLDARDLQQGDPVGPHEILHHVDLGLQFVGHGLAVGLVGFEGLVAERGPPGVEDDGDVLGLALPQEPGEHVVEAVDGVGRKPAGVGQALDGEEGPVDVVAAVDEVEGGVRLHGHGEIPSGPVRRQPFRPTQSARMQGALSGRG